MDDSLKWQYRRLMVETPVALYLVFLSAQEYGWGTTLYWLKFFAVNVSILVALTKQLIEGNYVNPRHIRKTGD